MRRPSSDRAAPLGTLRAPSALVSSTGGSAALDGLPLPRSNHAPLPSLTTYVPTRAFPRGAEWPACGHATTCRPRAVSRACPLALGRPDLRAGRPPVHQPGCGQGLSVPPRAALGLRCCGGEAQASASVARAGAGARRWHGARTAVRCDSVERSSWLLLIVSSCVRPANYVWLVDTVYRPPLEAAV